jgi:DNA-binding transcriptional MerR regulator
MSDSDAPAEAGMNLPSEEPGELISTSEAARICGLTVSTISMWNQHGYITPSGLDDGYRPLYKRLDVMRAAQDARLEHRSAG